ncbi:MAG TPA: 50S ribosomal protein L4 [Vicinamibacterales bacterium]|nr:50S ribosomal protein L4 [Vicinamibacterales bacterium]
MKLDVINAESEKVGSVDLDDAVFAGPIKTDVIWASVVRQNASERRGTHMTKNRALVSGTGKKPYAQKGTGRAQVGSSRTPLWRHGGTVFGPQPRSYDYAIPKKVERGALRAALASKLRDGVVVVVDELKAAEKKTKPTAELLKKLGATAKTLVVDVRLDENFNASARNIAGVKLVSSGRLTARDVMDTTRIIATRAAVERLQEVLG